MKLPKQFGKTGNIIGFDCTGDDLWVCGYDWDGSPVLVVEDVQRLTIEESSIDPV